MKAQTIKSPTMRILFFLLFFCFSVAEAQIVNIPDSNFKNRLIYLGVDLDNDGNIQTTEAQSFTAKLELSGANITDFTGVESFTNVTILGCRSNNITSLNLSNMPNLKSLDAGFNPNLAAINLNNIALDSLRLNSNNMSNLNLSTFSSLKYLDCSYNHITNLNVSNLTNLKNLNCSSNWLSNIDVTSNTQLEYLNFDSNQITTINLNNNNFLKEIHFANNFFSTISILNLINLEKLYCGNNSATSLTLTNLPNLKELSSGGNALTSFDATYFPLLEYLELDGNHLTNIVVNGLQNLKHLSLGSNNLTAINLTGLQNLEYFSAINNQLNDLNFTGLTHLVSIWASNNTISNLIVTNLPHLTLVFCDYNQLTNLDFTGSNSLNYLYCNNNNLTTLSLSGLVNLSYIDCHQNSLSTINFAGLTELQTVLCDHNNITSLDFSSNPVLQNLSCTYNALTSINIKNGYPYINTNNFWHENPNLTFVCADEEELGNVAQILNQSINVNNGNVVYNTYCSFTPGGNYNTITGTVHYDYNNNGCDASDLPANNLKIGITNSSLIGATFTNTAGNYTFYTTVANQTITPELENPSYFNVTPLNAIVNFPNNNNLTQVQDFCISPNGNHPDLEIVLQPLTNARPGFVARYKLVIKNKGNMPLSNSTGLTLTYNNNKMSFVSATATPSSNNPGALEFGYFLNPFDTSTIELEFLIHSPVATNPTNIGDVLAFTANIVILGTDETPADNSYSINQNVVGAYDPNFITCLEGDNLPTSAIGDYLHYGITFENTGNYYAENVVVKDVIDTTKYDVNSIQLLNTSHPVHTRITGNVVEFIFENINLAATSGNPPVGGHGDVLFKIRSLSNLVSGDVAIKSAKIFFDYNAPIDTNMAETTYSNLNNSIFQLDTNVSVAPNPTHGIVSINSKFDIKSIELFDVQGRILETSIENNTSAKLDISGKQNGIYFLKITTEKGSKVEKIVKE